LEIKHVMATARMSLTGVLKFMYLLFED
jgi:hypothetical protein